MGTALSQFAGSVLLQQGGTHEPQRKSNFALIVSGIGNNDQLTLCLKSAQIPGVKLTQKQIKYFNETSHYPGSVTPFEATNLTYHDYLDIDTYRSLAEWYRQVYTPENGAIGWAKNYKRNGRLLLLPPGTDAMEPGAVTVNEASAERVWQLRGLYPIDLSPDSEFDHDNDGDNAMIKFVLSVDKAVPIPMGRIIG